MASQDLADIIGGQIPFLRRYARALTGSQEHGDTYAAATLQTILEDSSVFDMDIAPKTALFRVFHTIWSGTGAALEDGESRREQRAMRHMARLTADTREALLLHTIEEMDFDEIGTIMRISATEAEELTEIAYREMSKSISGRVLIIEDEPIISVDLEAIVTEMGHRVTGIARTEERAVELADQEVPDLILSDIQLADDSSGLDAVNRIHAAHPGVPVIVITAFPERLLTGETDEPAFLISKPYEEAQVRSAVSQAMFFASVETLTA